MAVVGGILVVVVQPAVGGEVLDGAVLEGDVSVGLHADEAAHGALVGGDLGVINGEVLEGQISGGDADEARAHLGGIGALFGGVLGELQVGDGVAVTLKGDAVEGVAVHGGPGVAGHVDVGQENDGLVVEILAVLNGGLVEGHEILGGLDDDVELGIVLLLAGGGGLLGGGGVLGGVVADGGGGLLTCGGGGLLGGGSGGGAVLAGGYGGVVAAGIAGGEHGQAENQTEEQSGQFFHTIWVPFCVFLPSTIVLYFPRFVKGEGDDLQGKIARALCTKFAIQICLFW